MPGQPAPLLPAASFPLPLPASSYRLSHRIASHHTPLAVPCLPACPALTGLQASLRFLISNSIRLRTQLRLLLSFASHALTPFCATVIGITVSNNYNVNVQQGAWQLTRRHSARGEERKGEIYQRRVAAAGKAVQVTEPPIPLTPLLSDPFPISLYVPSPSSPPETVWAAR